MSYGVVPLPQTVKKAAGPLGRRLSFCIYSAAKASTYSVRTTVYPLASPSVKYPARLSPVATVNL